MAVIIKSLPLNSTYISMPCSTLENDKFSYSLRLLRLRDESKSILFLRKYITVIQPMIPRFKCESNNKNVLHIFDQKIIIPIELKRFI